MKINAFVLLYVILSADDDSVRTLSVAAFESTALRIPCMQMWNGKEQSGP